MRSVRTSRKVLGLGERELSVLNAHLTVLPRGLLCPGDLNVSFMEAAKLLERASCMDERRFRRGEARLEEVGLVGRKISGNRRRFAVRDGEGRIVNAYGIDLAPLLERASEIHEIADRVRREAVELRGVKSKVSAILSCIADICFDSPKRVQDTITDIRRAMRRSSLGIEEAAGCLRAARDLEEQAQALREVSPSPALPCPSSSDRSDIDPCTEAACSGLHTMSDISGSSDRASDDDGRCVRRNESLRREYMTTPTEMDLRQEVEHAWSEAGVIRSFYPSPPRSGQALSECLSDFSRSIGLDGRMMATLVTSLGLRGAVLTLDYMAAASARIKNPSGYVRTMLKAHSLGRSIAGGRVKGAAVG